MGRKHFGTVRSSVFAVLLVTSVIVYILNYRTAKELNTYGGKEDFYVVYGEDVEVEDEPATRAYKSESDHYVDSFDSLLITNRNWNIVDGKKCREKRDVVFIKTMKCATETLASVLRRFGYLRRLNFVLPRKKNIYLGWPFVMEEIDYRQSDKPFNILIEHSIYNKTVMSNLMPKKTSYITILREPYSHFKSAFHYFNVANISKVKFVKDRLSEYIYNINEYEKFYRSREGSPLRYCIPDGFSVTKNLLSHCLGIPLGFPTGREDLTNDLTAVQTYIEQLDRDFSLVMIMEYFHESLVLLKRIMCWSFEDIIYQTSNVGNYTYKQGTPNPGHLKIHHQWSSLDYVLYNHFNRTFWRKIDQQGDGFHREVAAYNLIQRQVSDYCQHVVEDEPLKISDSEFNEAFIVTQDFCLIMKTELLTFIKTRFDHEEFWMEPDEELKGPKRGC